MMSPSIELFEKIHSEIRLFRLVPVEGTLNVKFDGRFSFESILLHLRFCDSRSITSKAGRAEEGLRDNGVSVLQQVEDDSRGQEFRQGVPRFDPKGPGDSAPVQL